MSKILNRGNSAQSSPSQFNPLQGAAGFQRSSQAGGSFLKNIMNPGSINGFLNNTQNVLKTAQQMGPMIQQFQQYGPLVKNLPAMWKLYRGLSAAESDEDESEASTDSFVEDLDEEQPEAKKTTEKQKKKKQTAPLDNSKNKRTQSGGSKPKLYV
ncbi:VrrA/YqfQ family protein [Bacillus sp. AK031]